MRDLQAIANERFRVLAEIGQLESNLAAEKQSRLTRVVALDAELAEAQHAATPEAKLDAALSPVLERLAKAEAFVASIKPHFEAEGTPTGDVLHAKTGAITPLPVASEVSK